MNRIKQAICLASLCALALVLSGCSGIHATPSVSPATFLLPGLGQKESQAPPVQGSDLTPVSSGFLAAH
ncbi:MAG: hypothetical protein FJ405_00825 [Verrucomicrobia bacterium]|nr:hypothetical protein [Verrucomicrobiota bacterium]